MPTERIPIYSPESWTKVMPEPPYVWTDLADRNRNIYVNTTGSREAKSYPETVRFANVTIMMPVE